MVDDAEAAMEGDDSAEADAESDDDEEPQQ